MDFFTEMKKNTLVDTENGAKAYLTTGKSLLDLNYSVGSMRDWDEDRIVNSYGKAFEEDPELALRWLFFARNIRGGMGERRVFRAALRYIVEIYSTHINFEYLYNMIAKYGRIDDFFSIIDYADNETLRDIGRIINIKFWNDVHEFMDNRPITLMAKWMPSVNASSEATKARGRKVAKMLGMSERSYRQLLAKMRNYSNVIESKITANNWSEINYEAVPSLANLKYKDAFIRHDAERRRNYLEALSKGEVKINSSAAFPHDIVSRYMLRGDRWSYRKIEKEDTTLEAMWKALPREEITNTLVVADGSGSMTDNLGNTAVTALDVANALAIYFSECNTGVFANRYITFSDRPQFVEFCSFHSLREKLNEALRHNECANTNIEAVFRLVLNTTIKKHATQKDMPARILVISDMEFDYMTTGRTDKALFESLAEEYAAAGYKLPKLIFWNVCSRTMGIPLTENEEGVALLSGFSPASIKMAMTDETDPYKILVKELENYKEVDKIFGV